MRKKGSSMRIAITLFIASSMIRAQSITGSQSNVDSVLHQLKSSSWMERSLGFEKAVEMIGSNRQSNDDKGVLRVGLISLLITENTQSRTEAPKEQASPNVSNGDSDGAPPSGTWSEERSDYYGDLIGAVGDLNDVRAIPALLGAAATGGMATRGVARFGTPALDPVIEQINGRDPLLAGGAVFVLRDMLERRTVSDAPSMVRIKNALRVALARPELAVREPAIFAIEYLPDREEFVPLLQQIAANDPIKIDGLMPSDGADGGQLYPVRRDARSLLSKIANHEPPVIDRGVN